MATPKKKYVREYHTKVNVYESMDRTGFFAFLFHVAKTNIKQDIKEIRIFHINPKKQLHNYVHNKCRCFWNGVKLVSHREFPGNVTSCLDKCLA